MTRARDLPKAIFCDFDGTIIQIDGTDAVLEQFATSEWRTWEDKWVAGQISTQECLARQAGCLRVSRQALETFASQLPIDKGFFRIARECQARNIPLTIVSDGFDVVSQAVLKKHGLDYLPLYANQLKWVTEDQGVLSFPNALDTCTSGAGTCKCAKTQSPGVDNGRTVYIGDGRSDFCVAAKGHHEFAQGTLSRWCASQNIPFELFVSLEEVADQLFQPEVVVP